MKHELAPDGQLREARLLPSEEVDDELLARFFSLSEGDKSEILKCRGDESRLGFALALCFYRMTARFPKSYEVIPLRAINELGAQLGILPVRALSYPASDDTRWEHERRIREYLHVRAFDNAAQADLSAWIMDLALEGETTEILRERAETHLRKQNVSLPGSTVFDRVIQHALAGADEVCIRKVVERVDAAYREELLGVVQERGGRGQPLLTRLKRLNGRASPAAIKELADHIATLRRLGGDAIDLSGIPSTLVDRLARVVDERAPSFFRRMRRDRALAFLGCFVTDMRARAIDTLLYADHRIVTGIEEDAREDYARWLQERAAEADEEGRFLAEIVRQLRDTQRPVDPLWERLLQEHAPERFERALATWADRPKNKRSVLDELIRRHPHLRKFTPRILDAVEFEATAEGQAVLEGLETLKAMNALRRKQLPSQVPLAWATPAWRRKIEEALEHSPARARRTWETGLWLATHQGLQAGTLCVRGSRRYRPLQELVYGDSAWAEQRKDAYARLKLPEDPRDFLARLRSRYLEIVRQVDADLPNNPFARVVDGQLSLSRDPAEVSLKDLVFYRNLIRDHFPPVDLDQLLIQVARRVPYLRHFRTVSSFAPRSADFERKLLICIFGLGCNLDLSRLARSTGVKREVIADIMRRYFHLERLIDANAELVNYHHGLPLSRLWGTGEHSGSDGQRHRVHGRSLLAGFLPPYFGHHGRGFTIYRHTSDQDSVFSTQAISTLDRESQYVMDGFVDNRSVLRPTRHSTDTHGASDIVFGLMTLLGYDFCPRIARLHRQRFFRIPEMPPLAHIEPLFEAEPIQLDAFIIEQWDYLVRTGASIEDGTVTPSVLIRQLENAGPTNRAAEALRALGRIAKTLFLLRYIQQPSLRRQIRRQLNRCEAENDLSHFVTFAEHGVYRTADLDFVVDRSQCATLVMNNIVIWNTETLASKALPALRERGIEVPTEVLAHLSPLMRKHINPYGAYPFDLEAAHDPTEANRLRQRYPQFYRRPSRPRPGVPNL